MIGKLRAASIKRTLPTFFILLLVGIICIAVGCGEWIDIVLGGADLSADGRPQLRDMDYANYELGAIVDWYAEDEDGRYYIIPVGSQFYMGMYVYNEDSYEAEELCRKTIDYFNGDTDTLDIIPQKTHGIVYEMEGQELQFFREYFTDGGFMEDELDDLIICFTYFPLDFFEVIKDDSPFMLCIGICALIGAIVALVLALSGFFQRKLVEYIKQSGIPYDSFSEDFEYSGHYGSTYLGSQYIIYKSGLFDYVIPASEVLWAYKFDTTTVHTTYGIKSGETHNYSIRLATADKVLTVDGGNKEKIVDDCLEDMQMRYRHMLIGYSEQLSGLYEHNRAEFMNIIRDRTNQ